MAEAERKRPDWMLLLAGLTTLAVAAHTISDGYAGPTLRWSLAMGAGLLGCLILLRSLLARGDH